MNTIFSPMRVVLLGGMVLCLGFASASVAQVVHAKSMAKQNLFSLVGNLNITTGQILTNSQELNGRVGEVEGKLQQLEAQSQILNQQTQTGKSLSDQLSTQIALTTNNVATMEQILHVEQKTSTVASHVQNQSQSLANTIEKNATVLMQLDKTLGTANNESSRLNSQMDNLISELQSSQQEFRLFGQVNDLLGHKGLLGNATGFLNKSTSGLLGGSKGAGSASQAVGGATGALQKTTSGLTGGLLGPVLGGSAKTGSSGASQAANNSTGATTTNGGLLGLLGGLN
ncbi:hypothetical protein [Alicyclobacillus dauci]|uniref:N-terminal domain of peptidoglycan hydrolase CwlO-containing protein n=1 Tax=Alicyclobacillus dauci TaxID=1475485 RepID=A0ABY6Z0A8_9BACL|nr:hypothetical protein [Alicyclobacillus dauci]WAH36144.1 hypothetical protein NZD86_18120 [Alicyclobacillus dauci]